MASSSTWSLEAYCALEQARVIAQQETIRSQLSESSQHFLQLLNLSSMHPFCHPLFNETTATTAATTATPFPAPNVPPMGPLQEMDFSMWEQLVNLWFQTAPPLLALSELWLRLFASILAPLCVAHLLWKYIQPPSKTSTDRDTNDTTDTATIRSIQQHQHQNGNGHHHHDHHNGNGHAEPTANVAINGKAKHQENGTTAPNTSTTASTSTSSSTNIYLALWSILGVAASVVLTTDTLYVLQFGPQFGVTWLILSTYLAMVMVVMQHQHQQQQHRIVNSFHIRILTGVSIFLLWCLTIHLLTKHHYDHSLQQDPGAVIPWLSFGNAHDAVLIDEGLYHDVSNPTSTKVAQQLRSSTSSAVTMEYAKHATPWMPTGDSRTGLPFLLSAGIPTPAWIRVWLPVPSSAPPTGIHKMNTSFQQNGTSDHVDDDVNDLEEYVALDIAFPSTGRDGSEVGGGGFNPSQPVYLLLHGLNGGSEEEFVKDFTHRRTAEGATIVVMVARGLMDLPVRGWNVFHGARISDVHETALVLQRVTQDVATAFSSSPPILASVGYSMGAIILSNYVARYGKNCPIQAAVAISGGLDMRQVVTFYRAQRLWQPMITFTLRHQFVLDKWGERVRARLTRDQMIHMMRSTHITEIDETAVVAYNGFDDLIHYYSEMSLLGDIPLDEYYNETLLATNSVGQGSRVHNVSIPLLVIHALDDPLITWRTVAANRGFLHPSTLTKTGTGNLFLLLTKAGGHVGWPTGWNPRVHRWMWMSNVAKDFIQSAIEHTVHTNKNQSNIQENDGVSTATA